MIKKLIDCYIEKHQKQQLDELEYFKNINSLDEVIEKASMAKNSDGKKFSHQYRLTKTALSSAKGRLLNEIERIKKVNNFDELHELIKKTTQGISGVGILYYYDTALRIGAHREFYPTKIFLHNGSLEGAKRFNININKDKTTNKNNLPNEFKRLKCFEIENFLCIFKNKKLKNNSKC